MSGELQNVPPVWTAAFHWLACLTYLLLLPHWAKEWHGWFPAMLRRPSCCCLAARFLP